MNTTEAVRYIFRNGFFSQVSGIVRKVRFPKEQMEQLFQEVVKGQFQALLKMKLVQEGQKAHDAASKDFIDQFLENLRLKSEKSANQIYDRFAKMADPRLREIGLRIFEEEIKAIFVEARFDPHGRTHYASAIVAIANAILKTTLDIPLRQYGNEKIRVSEDTKNALGSIIEMIEKLKKGYKLTGIEDIPQARGRLHRSIAQADNHIWLPLKSLITAPLADDELGMYARKGNNADTLAYQIMRNDGVILVTGYRGVGKSTYINKALQQIEKLEEKISSEQAWRVIPIQINVAKASSVVGVLRLCVRALFRTFLHRRDAGDDLLTEDEFEFLKFAYLRASTRFNMTQGETVTKLRSLQGGAGFSPGDVLVGPLKPFLMGILPDLKYKSSKEWNQKTDHSISLLDYDEDRAEEDIVQFISNLTVQRIKNNRSPLKLVFIFDELDKMEVNEGQDALIRSLKNLFLTRHTVFLLVTSKDFYYLLLQDRKKEDTVLGSYFSSVVTVPMFTSQDTQELLINLLDVPPNLADFETSFISDLAHYLTYQARGLPREIFREIRSIQQWLPDTLQSYLSELSVMRNRIRIYAQIQQNIENLKSRSVLPGDQKELPLLQERIWLDAGRQEQIRRGLYILVEELLSQGSLTVEREPWKRKGPEVVPEYTKNFSTISHADFCDIFDQLAHQFSELRLSEDPGLVLFKRILSEDMITITVEPSFYSKTGQQIVQPAHTESLPDVSAGNLMDQVEGLLRQNSWVAVRRALDMLERRSGEDITDEVQDELFRIFVSPESEISCQVDAGRHISEEGFYRNLEKAPWERLVQVEMDSAIIERFESLIKTGTSTIERKGIAIGFLELLLDSMLQKYRYAYIMPSIFKTIVADIEVLVDWEEDALRILKKILSSSYFKQRTDEDFWLSLSSLAKKAGTNLPLLLLDEAYLDTAINQLSGPAFETLMDSAGAEGTLELGRKLLGPNSSIPYLYTRIEVDVVLRLYRMLPNERAETILKDWLGSETWDAQRDEMILIEAAQADRELSNRMKEHMRSVNTEDASLYLHQRLSSLDRSATNLEKRKAAIESARYYENPLWLHLLVGGLIIAVLLLIPTDMFPEPTWLQLIGGRLLQLLAPAAVLGSLLCVLIWFGDEDWLMIALAFILVAVSVFLYWLLNILGFPITFLGELLLTVLWAAVFIAPFASESLIRRWKIRSVQNR